MFEEHQQRFLNNMQNSGNLILVEGKKDRKVLQRTGLDNIFEISGKQLEKVADILKEKHLEVTILTDYDKEGIKLYKRLKSLLISNDVKVNDDIRRKFKCAFLVNKVEELNGYFK